MILNVGMQTVCFPPDCLPFCRQLENRNIKTYQTKPQQNAIALPILGDGV